MPTFAESTVEDAALAWLGELGYAVLHGQEIEMEERVVDERGNVHDFDMVLERQALDAALVQ